LQTALLQKFWNPDGTSKTLGQEPIDLMESLQILTQRPHDSMGSLQLFVMSRSDSPSTEPFSSECSTASAVSSSRESTSALSSPTLEISQQPSLIQLTAFQKEIDGLQASS
jgi:hypothetical protein